ncbi:MAG TPA: S8 family serine peptidase [candidate division Zixibacteria bacterium]|nr:S8 family serine peptidase [candidate division Zixibacteria bacterium]
MSAVRRRRPLPSFALVAAILVSAVAGPVAAVGPAGPLGHTSVTPRTGTKGTGRADAPQATGRLIVQYRPGTSEAARDAARRSIGARRVGDVALPDAELIEPAGGLAAAGSVLRNHPDVVAVTREYRRTLFVDPLPPAEPRFDEQWALHNVGQQVNGFDGVPDVDMNVPEAWQETTGSSDVVVAVIDDGVDFSHPDLADRAWTNPDEIPANGIDDDGNGHIDDVNGWDFCNEDATLHDANEAHGTHVAGTIAAANNGIGVVGVAPGVRIMALKVFRGGDPEDEDCGTDTMAIDAIAYAVSEGADIINASWGGTAFSGPLEDAFSDASALLAVAAAGNANSDNDAVPVYPASFDLPNILAVAAIHNEGHLTSFTNFGATSVDLAAPGEDVLSTVPGGDYELMSGTSMAAPNATGVAALALSKFPTRFADGASLRAHLIHTARALPSTLGWIANPRLVDARAAVVSRPDVIRLAGLDRYATSAAISSATFVPGVPQVFIATGENFPDALAGGAVAAQYGSPLLLVKRTSIPPVVLDEIERLKPVQIFVLGGTGAVAESVRTQLAAYDDPASTGPFRLEGADRYATAAEIAEAGFDAPWGGTAFVANGESFPDALAGGAASGVVGGPVLLTRATSLPAPTKAALTALAPSRIVILGGTVAVSAAVANELKAYAAGQNVVRWFGADRYATAAAISGQAFASAASVFLAAGSTFPDALSGDPSAGAFGGPLLLTNRTTLPAPAKTELTRLAPVRVFVLGGSAVVADSVITEVNGLFP